MREGENTQRVSLDPINQTKWKSAERKATPVKIQRLADIGRIAEQGDYPPYLDQ